MGKAEDAITALDESVDAELAYTQEQQETNAGDTASRSIIGVGIAALISLVGGLPSSGRGIVTPLRQLGDHEAHRFGR